MQTKRVVIANPIINSPFEEPKLHFRFSEEGITDEIALGRRQSEYFVPIARPRKKSQQIAFETWTKDRIRPNEFINRVRGRVELWRRGGYTGITGTTRRLLEHWQNPERERKLFFCQIEALETAIYITEVAHKYGDNWIADALRRFNADANPLLYRAAFKMATGSGKTVVMAMLIAWHALNKMSNRQDARFSDAFLIVTPGITIRDRLRVLLPSDPNNYYQRFDLLPLDLRSQLYQAKIVITNFHAFQLREKVKAGKLTKELLAQDKASPFTETPDQMVRRVCRELGNKRSIIVLNDEGHHCYRRKPDSEKERHREYSWRALSREERSQAKQNTEEARVWISGLEAVKAKIGLKVAYDLSATPFFLRGSGYDEGTLFPWVVSDFSLIDAIECGIVKVPRVPVDDNAMIGDYPTYRHLWPHIRDDLPRKGRKIEAISGEPKLPAKLQSALHSLYNNYQKYHEQWEENKTADTPPPVFIVVCNNTNVSKMMYDYIAGWEKKLDDEHTILVPGALPIFSNVQDGRWTARPNTILIDSKQLESGEAMSRDFKKIAAREITEFKAEYRARFPGRDAEGLTDEDLLREVMNTVGQPGKLGEPVKCVVSVSMLTEGWDANTVTHILGVRAFGTQLLCEQVVGRGLRRISFATETRQINVDGDVVEFEAFPVEYAEVYGVPFSFIPTNTVATPPKPGPRPTRVRALEERIGCEIIFPRLVGYRYELPGEQLTANFTPDSQMAISTLDVPTRTESAPIVGESSIHTLWDLSIRRGQEVDFLLAKLVLERYFRDAEGHTKPWLFPQLLRIVRRWRAECLTLKDNTFPQLLLLHELASDAAEHIYQAIVQSTSGEKRLHPILRPYDPVGSTRYVDFDTTREVYPTGPELCHVSHIVLDSGWEAKMAQSLEEMDEVVRYVKNHGLGFSIPYTLNGQGRQYTPDFIIHIDDGHQTTGVLNLLGARYGKPEQVRDSYLLNLIVEVSGEARKDKAAKVAAARNLWIPAINNHGGYGRWAFIEITDPWDAKNTIRAMLKGNILSR